MACSYHAEIRTDEKPHATEREKEKITMEHRLEYVKLFWKHDYPDERSSNDWEIKAKDKVGI